MTWGRCIKLQIWAENYFRNLA